MYKKAKHLQKAKFTSKTDGLPGAAGPQGAKGERGDPGGPQRPRRLTGARGAQGPKGPAGPLALSPGSSQFSMLRIYSIEKLGGAWGRGYWTTRTQEWGSDLCQVGEELLP